MNPRVVVSMRGITKRFPGVLALDHVDFEVLEGEIHGLLGENGAGKTTLMNILYGLYQADRGEIYIYGKRVKLRSPKDALALGVGMVHQHLTLIPNFTVVENIILGLKSPKHPFLDIEGARRRIIEISRKYGLEIDPDVKIRNLPVGVQQRVEILKVLYRGARILILDEPTAVLTPQEVEALFKSLKDMVRKGLTIIFVTHHIPEVFRVCDRVTILRRGKKVATLHVGSTNPRELARLMVGRDIMFDVERKATARRRCVLAIKGLHTVDDRKALHVRIGSLELYEGEILGIAGVSGNGQKEFVESLLGIRKVISGKILVNSTDLTSKHYREVIEKYVCVVPEDRLKEGILPTLTVAENLVAGLHKSHPFSNRRLLNHREILKFAQKLIREFSIKTPSERVPVKVLSGGNIQKVVVARALAKAFANMCRVIIAYHPTRGLDIAATDYVHRRLIELRNSGKAILLISEDLEEIFKLSDRIAVMFRGEVVGVIPREKANVKDVGLLMTGVRRIS